MLKKLKKDINAELKIFLKEASRSFNLRSTSKLLYAGIKDFLGRDGKRIRPILFLISYQGYTKRKKISYKKLLRSSLSVELLHAFLLVHDDVIDNSSLRRGKPTLHRLFNKWLARGTKSELGPNLSIVSGDIISAMALEALLTINEDLCRKEQALKTFSKIAAYTGIGEFIDVVYNIKKIENIKEKDVFLTYTLKTAKYTFEGPLLIGATLAGIKKDEALKLSKLGIMLGQAFQIQDDLLDIFSSSKRIGKPILSDLNESKKTLPVQQAYKMLKGKNKKLLKQILEKDKKTYKDLIRFRKLIKYSGADKYCLKKIASLLAKADSICSKLRMKPKYKLALEEFINTSFSKIDY